LIKHSVIARSRTPPQTSAETLNDMFTRLKQAFTESECRLAREVLKSLCRSESGLQRAELEAVHAHVVPDAAQRALVADELDYVLDALKHDGYLLQEITGGQRTRFASNILRDYWQRKTS
jgi:hypothetical protein